MVIYKNSRSVLQQRQQIFTKSCCVTWQSCSIKFGKFIDKMQDYHLLT